MEKRGKQGAAACRLYHQGPTSHEAGMEKPDMRSYELFCFVDGCLYV